MSESTPEMVVSGEPYTVTEVAGHAPTSLDEFVGALEFQVAGRTGEHAVAGEGQRVDDLVYFNQKGERGIGKDVRVWHVSATAEGFFAEVDSPAPPARKNGPGEHP